jgi:hypothetical protein
MLQFLICERREFIHCSPIPARELLQQLHNPSRRPKYSAHRVCAFDPVA